MYSTLLLNVSNGISALRKDKLYLRLDELIAKLKEKDYQFLKF